MTSSPNDESTGGPVIHAYKKDLRLSPCILFRLISTKIRVSYITSESSVVQYQNSFSARL